MGIETPEKPVRPYANEAAAVAVVAAFRARTLPGVDWTHQAHLTVGLWHVIEFGEGRALDLLREGISRYNESVGVANSDTRGYHETLTRFYVWAAAVFAKEADRSRGFLALVNGFLASPIASKLAPFGFYSRDRLLSVAARHGWVAPDLRPLVPVPGWGEG